MMSTDTGHGIKDLILITLLFGALIGCWYVYQQKKSSQKHLHRMMKDMESLHKAELALEDLQVYVYNSNNIYIINIYVQMNYF